MALDKLVDSSQLDSDLNDIADAILAKSGGSAPIAFPAGFVSEIGDIPSGGNLISSTANLLKDATWDAGYINNSGVPTGSLGTNKDIVFSYVPVNPGDTIYEIIVWPNVASTPNSTIGFYDENKQYLSKEGSSGGQKTLVYYRTATAPANCHYIRVHCATHGQAAVFVSTSSFVAEYLANTINAIPGIAEVITS